MCAKTLLYHAKVYTEDGFRDGAVLMSEGRFCEILPPATPELIGQVADAGQVLDLGGRRLIPGLIDTHLHGAAGIDLNRADEVGLEAVSRYLAKQGVTRFFVSLLSDAPETMAEKIKFYARFVGKQMKGAILAGIHLEGPWLSPRYRGVISALHLQEGTFDWFRTFAKAGDGTVRAVTLAPELAGAQTIIHMAADYGITICLGHSGADYLTAKEAIRAGARVATHTFNAMAPLSHHEPGVLGAVLESDCYCEFIPDGHHVHEAVLRLLRRMKGDDRLLAVTDAMAGAGMCDGVYRLGEACVRVTAGEAFRIPDGTRAGSVLQTTEAMIHVCRVFGTETETVVPMFSRNHARAYGLTAVGRLEPGYEADCVALGAHGLPEDVWIGGRHVITS